jgi:SAM-dependent methyltransferase
MNDYTSIADLYDAHVTDTRDHSFWSSLAAVSAGPIVELTAGTGRATTALHAGTTERVVALDCSHAMLSRLVKRFEGQTRVPLPVCGDLVSLPLASSAFDLVVIPFNSWSELIEESERTEALSEMRRVLAPSGRGVVTLHNPSRRRETLDGAVRRLGPFEWRSRRLEILVSGSISTSGVAVSEQVYQLLDSADQVVEERRLELQFVLPDVAQLTVVAHASDLEVEVIYGDYDRSPYDPVSSPYILALLRAPTE